MLRRPAKTLPHRAATALVTSDPFAWSRNPICLGNTIAFPLADVMVFRALFRRLLSAIAGLRP